MKVFFNHNLLEDQEVTIPITDRCFAYGDGLFETISIKNGQVQFLNQHLNRLKKGMEAFGLTTWNQVEEQEISNMFTRLCQHNKITDMGRARIQVWRKEGGLYTPNQHQHHILISAQAKLPSTSFQSLHVGFSKTVRLVYSPTSAYKTMSALPYVMAGIEKQNRGLDDLILLSTKDHISECIASNIFWLRRGTIYTPSIRSACIEGIRRAQLIKGLRRKGYIVRRTLAKKSSLLLADVVFNCNVSGIQLISQIDDQPFSDNSPLVEELKDFV